MSLAELASNATTSAPARASEVVLELEEATFASLKDPRRLVVEAVDWAVRSGEFWAVGGLQGAGKSDFLAAAAGLMRPLAGRYRLFGRDAVTAREPEWLELRRRVGLVFDGGQLLRHLTVAENVALPLRYHRSADESEWAGQVAALLELAGVTRWASRFPTSLNRGAQQRVGLARALALQPEVLLLDTPLTGLDPRDTNWWLGVLGELARGHPRMDGRPVTLIVTCDDFRPWQNRARQFAMLQDRRLLALETRLEVVRAENELLRALLGEPAGTE
jgi:ABC-type transporter Mla maintaining outer membrane lipid asymmetry ATPase subunit MlaF